MKDGKRRSIVGIIVVLKTSKKGKKERKETATWKESQKNPVASRISNWAFHQVFKQARRNALQQNTYPFRVSR